jgi:hypothetical protein
VKQIKKISLLIICFVTSLKPVYGYLDPGSGSFILQLIIGGGIAALYTIKTYWGKITSFVRHSKKNNDDESGT